MKRAWFVTGTDTGVGKTTVSCGLLQRFTHLGLDTVGMKPVATGCQYEQGNLRHDDVEQLIANSSCSVGPPSQQALCAEGTLARQWVNPYAFVPAIAPHLAAQEAGVGIDFSVIQTALRALQARADIVVVEGAGGFRVPLGAEGDMADLCAFLGVPLILVVGMRLGCLNHALLTVEAIRSRRLLLAGWVANRLDPHMVAFDGNLETLRHEIEAPCLGVMPFMPAGGIRNMLPPLALELLDQ